MSSQSSQSSYQTSSSGDSGQMRSSQPQSAVQTSSGTNHPPRFVQSGSSTGSSTGSDEQDGIGTGTNLSSSFSSANQSPVFASGDTTNGADDGTGAHSAFNTRVGQTSTDLGQNRSGQTSAKTGDTLASNSAGASDTHTVKVTSTDLGQSKTSQTSAGTGDTLSFTSAGANDTHTGKAAPAHAWTAGEIAWACDFARKAVGSVIKGQAAPGFFSGAVDDGRSTASDHGVSKSVQGSASSSSASAHDASAWEVGQARSSTDKTSSTSSGASDHSATDNTHALETYHDYGLTGFEF